jgi:hypothetical protein
MGYRAKGGGDLSISEGKESVSAKAEAHYETKNDVMFEEEYRPRGEPKVPDGLVWYGHEASWRSLAQRRLDFRTTKFQASLNYSESFGIDASVRAVVEGIGLKIGGNFSDFEATSWDFEGEFA